MDIDIKFSRDEVLELEDANFQSHENEALHHAGGLQQLGPSPSLDLIFDSHHTQILTQLPYCQR